jgi:eukaryotic-like serine/threonine-protein kinase
VNDCRRLTELDMKLPKVLRGDIRLSNEAERLELARLCYLKTWFATSARLYEQALASQPALTDNLEASHRYKAACTAVLAGDGRGTENIPLDQESRARWRAQALMWLRADVAAWAQRLERAPERTRAAIESFLRRCQNDSDLASVRDTSAMVNLSEEEQKICRELWNEVAALLLDLQFPADPFAH